MSDEMSNREYWDEVASLAASIQEETLADMDGEPGEDWTEDDYREALYERIHETIDGHHWVIYTAYNLDVLRHSNNDDYTLVNFGPESVADETGIKWDLLAYGALYGDVMERIDRDPIELPEAVA